MPSLKTCLLFLAASFTATEAIWFFDKKGKQFQFNSGVNQCTNFPLWLNDKAYTYKIEAPWRCYAFEDGACSGPRSLALFPTNLMTVPMKGISSVLCWSQPPSLCDRKCKCEISEDCKTPDSDLQSLCASQARLCMQKLGQCNALCLIE
jgi:hypothetical protein